MSPNLRVFVPLCICKLQYYKRTTTFLEQWHLLHCMAFWFMLLQDVKVLLLICRLPTKTRSSLGHRIHLLPERYDDWTCLYLQIVVWTDQCHTFKHLKIVPKNEPDSRTLFLSFHIPIVSNKTWQEAGNEPTTCRNHSACKLLIFKTSINKSIAYSLYHYCGI